MKMDKNVKRFLPLLLYSFMILLIINSTCCLNILKLDAVPSANLILRSVKSCENVGTEEIRFDLHITKLSRSNAVLYGNISNKIPLDKNVAIHLNVDVWGNGGWRKNFFVIKRDNACDSLNRLLTRCSTNNANIDCQPDLRSCPLPVGDVECKNITSKLFSDCAFSYVLGKFRVQNAYYKNNKRRGCFELTVEITDNVYKN